MVQLVAWQQYGPAGLESWLQYLCGLHPQGSDHPLGDLVVMDPASVDPSVSLKAPLGTAANDALRTGLLQDQMWAMLHSTYSAELPGESLDDGTVRLIIGHPHSQTDREIELLVNVYNDGREARVFHAMELGPKFRRFREENPNG